MLCLHGIAAAFLATVGFWLRLFFAAVVFCCGWFLLRSLLLAAVVAFCCGCWAAVLLCIWSMYPEFELCFFRDDISDPHAS